VAAEVSPCSERLAATRARVGSLSAVGPEVDQEMGRRREHLKRRGLEKGFHGIWFSVVMGASHCETFLPELLITLICR